MDHDGSSHGLMDQVRTLSTLLQRVLGSSDRWVEGGHPR